MTELPDTGRPTQWLFVGAGVAALAVIAGVSLLAGLFVFVPLVFVATLLKTAFNHYFGSADAEPSRSA